MEILSRSRLFLTLWCMILELVSGDVWEPFQKSATDFFSEKGISDEFFETENLCLGWMDAHIDANIVCYEEKKRHCISYVNNIPVNGKVDVPEGWKCFSEFVF